jgi:hypothetical protein
MASKSHIDGEESGRLRGQPRRQNGSRIAKPRMCKVYLAFLSQLVSVVTGLLQGPAQIQATRGGLNRIAVSWRMYVMMKSKPWYRPKMK